MLVNQSRIKWYKELCEKCDIILHKSSSNVRMSISALHVLNEHPSNLAKYSALVNSKLKLNKSFKSALIQIKELLNSIKYKKLIKAGCKIDETSVVFISHLLNPSQIGKEDFYFGDLPELLSNAGFPSNIILTNNTRLNFNEFVSGLWKENMQKRIILKKVLSIKNEFKIRRLLNKENRILKKELNDIQDPLLNYFYKFAIKESHSYESITTLRFYFQIKVLLSKLRPKVLILTYEGHAWERLAFAAAREILPKVKCIGYNHTINFPLQHASLRLLGKNFDPDIIYTAGNITKQQFQDSFSKTNIKIETIGIHRRITSETPKIDFFNKKPVCLVLPDGIVSEVLFLFDFVILAANRQKSIKYIFRLHPIISLKSLKEKYKIFNNIPSNVEFSTANLLDDFNNSRWVLYRGSNSAIYSVIYGLRPFYVQMRDELPIDSLYNLNTWKKSIANIEQFINFAMNDLNLSESVLTEESKEAIHYCNNYFTPLNFNNVLKDLININE
jgi:hypothetical protein